MKFVLNNNITDPTINLAMEEYVLKHLPSDDSYFLFYVNGPSIIVGKNQNTIEEVNKQYVVKITYMLYAVFQVVALYTMTKVI